MRLGETSFPHFRGSDGSYVDADDAGYQYLLDYRGASVPFPGFSISQLLAGEDIAGDWEFKMNFGERQVTARACFSKNADGSYAGTWTPNMPPQPEGGPPGTERPEIKFELQNIKFENQKLTFVQLGKLPDMEFQVTYSGTLKDGKLEGKFTGERGDMPATASRVKPPPILSATGSLSSRWTSASLMQS